MFDYHDNTAENLLQNVQPIIIDSEQDRIKKNKFQPFLIF
ncbi:hypothetical protein HMPREF0519_1460 [Lentilactobacillus hilgardii DSM 20176 = ATCC 8290]|uniref:Uncharacterized protein n=1 Tax=Lentilactobacillus hilgardii (strain ATCC 8290 / DSM 20176 / CCUG 30140 / JCM 1155 / KCTC 3500 / NBRC 15886 / NCIMB 8040 / NRRL B-1843 / 9) TaxID=1423757 RepID=C0XJP9_LENH9|nr:hypothetical protein HMPREF0519_1460 [Lentilactobacillus hilgardii DSM 20176 = ATCC 8290]